MLCDFGCGNNSIKTFKTGKNCCSNSANACPAMKEKNSTIAKNNRARAGDSYWKNGHPKGSRGGTSLKGKTYNEIFGDEEAKKKKQNLSHIAIRNQIYKNLSVEAKTSHAEKARENIVKRYESGWMPKAGRCKKYKHESPTAGIVFLDGTWELSVAKYLDEKKLNWIRNTERFAYINLKGKTSYYTPDFWIQEFNSYLEVKGYETELDRCKWSQFNKPLMVWKKKDLKEMGIFN